MNTQIVTMEHTMGPRITILNLVTQDALINISTSQFGLFVRLMNHVVEAMMAMTLDPQVNPNTNINIVEAQVSHQHNFTLEATTQLAQHDSNLYHNNWPNLMMLNTSTTLNRIKNGCNGNFHEPSMCPYLKFIHTTSHSR